LIHTLDLNHRDVTHSIAAYLVVGPDGPVLVETGPASTIPALQARLAEHGYSPADVRHVLLTHIHLDHAGAAGWWAQQGAQVYVHHVGARHVIDPARLLKSARRVYGDEMERVWGQTLPAPAQQVRALQDGETLQAGGLTFTALDTPGHARHHLVYLLDGVAFTGDAGGVRLPGSDFISITAAPPEFDLPLWQQTLARLLDLDLQTLYLTHFGPVANPRQHLQAVSALLDESAEFVRTRLQSGVQGDELVSQYRAWNRQRARPYNLSASDLQRLEIANSPHISVAGLVRYWESRE
jgi:glyoxylase-like metal-dependent hydrolase (beta-lactamase superfamily II)